jgi:hypothetical protein
LTRNLPKKWKPLCQRSGPCIQCKWYWPSAAVRKLPLQARDAVANMSMEEPSPQWSHQRRRSTRGLAEEIVVLRRKEDEEDAGSSSPSV